MSKNYGDAYPAFFFRETRPIDKNTQLVRPDSAGKTLEPIAETLIGMFDIVEIEGAPQLVIQEDRDAGTFVTLELNPKRSFFLPFNWCEDLCCNGYYGEFNPSKATKRKGRIFYTMGEQLVEPMRTRTTALWEDIQEAAKG